MRHMARLSALRQALTIALLLSASSVFAQAPVGPRPQTPPRDNQPPQSQTGTAVIKGRITAADTGPNGSVD